MAAHGLRRVTSGDHYVKLAILFLALLGAAGGASRSDEFQQALVRVAAILVIAAALWPLKFAAFRNARAPMIALVLVYLLPLVQLLPLPPSLWAGLPGHRIYASLAQQSDYVVWRPWTLSPDLTLNSLGGLLPATALLILTLALDFGERLMLARLVVGIACTSALLGLIQFASGASAVHLFRTSSDDSAVGLFANRNHQAVLMACAFPILTAIATIRTRQENSGHHLGLSLGAGALLLMGLAATGSRMGLLLGLIGLASATILYWLSSSMPRRATSDARRRSFLLSGSAIACLVPVALLLMRSGSVARLASDPVDQTRVAALGPMLEAARAFFPFGSGLGTFEPVYRRFEPNSLLSTIYLNQAHNEPLQLAIEGGLGALLLLLLFLGWWVRAALRSVRPRESVSRRALGMAMAATTLILMISSLVDYPLRTPLLSGLFAIACVELARSRRPADREE